MIACMASFVLGMVARLTLVDQALFLHWDELAAGAINKEKTMNRNQDKHSVGAAIVAVLVLTGTIGLRYAPLFL